MAVCAGIVKFSATQIRIIYNVADGTKGTSVNPYNFDDIYDTAIAGGWAPAVEKRGKHYYIPYQVYIYNSATYFSETTDLPKVVQFDCPAPADSYAFSCSSAANCLIGTDDVTELGYNNRGITFLRGPNLPLSGAYVNIKCGTGGEQYNGVYNCSFQGFQYVYFYGPVTGKLSVKFTSIYGVQFGMLSDATVVLEDVFATGGFYGLVPISMHADSRRISIGTCRMALLLQSGTEQNQTFRNVKCINAKTNSTYVRVGVWGVGTREFNFIDCDIDKTKMAFYASGPNAQTVHQYMKSTFNIYVADENGDALDGANVKVYNSQDTLVLDQDTVAGEITGHELAYFDKFAVYDGSVITTEDTVELEPFRVVVTKTGYQDLEISGITIIPGEQTNLFAQMILSTQIGTDMDAELTEENELNAELSLGTHLTATL